MDVRPALVADGEAAVLGQPRQRPLHHPEIPTEPLAALDSLPGNPAFDAATSLRAATRALTMSAAATPKCRAIELAHRVEPGSKSPGSIYLCPRTTIAKSCILIQGVDNPDQAPIRPTPTLVTTRNRLPQIHATPATIYPCTGV